MTESEIIKLIKDTVKREVAQMMMCQMTDTQDSNRASMQRFSTEGPSSNLRMIQPYGVASRPPVGIQAVVAPVNADPTHLNILGQFDSDRPTINQNEVCLYGPNGQIIYFNNAGETHLGSQTSNQPLVLGTNLNTWANDLVTAILNITYIGNLGAPVTSTLNEADFTSLVNQLTTIISTKIFGE